MGTRRAGLALTASLLAACGWGCRREPAPPTGPDKAAPASRSASGPAVAAPAPRLLVDKAGHRVILSARAAAQGAHPELKGAIEYVLVAKGGKEYETLFTTDLSPAAVYEAFSAIGLRPGRPAGEDTLPEGQPVRVFAEHEAGGRTVRRPVDEYVLDAKSGKPLAPVAWVHTGSVETVDPATGQPILQAHLTRSLIGLHPADASVLLANPRPASRQENIYRANVAALPAAGRAVRLIFQRVMSPVPAGTRRAHVFISGRVQGVGFRAFTQHQARVLGLEGFVRNLDDGRVEAVIEGPAEKVAQLLDKLKTGPRAARVTGLDVKDEQPEADFHGFDIRY